MAVKVSRSVKSERIWRFFVFTASNAAAPALSRWQWSACSVDELPQLINILKGDLSIVGPRPERPEIAAQYCEEMPEFALRLQAKAGLTGYAQVYGKYNTTPYDKLTMDLMYIAHPSIVEDLKIMFATVKILFMPESTEGVSEGQTTAMSGESH